MYAHSWIMTPSRAGTVVVTALITAVIVGVGVYFWQPLAGSNVLGKVRLGAPCDITGEALIDTQGMQCYWYGDVSDRRAMWIIPEIPYPNAYPYQNFTASWRTYQSPDGTFSLKFPPQG